MKKGGKNMKEKKSDTKVLYTKPVVVSQNKSSGSFAAGCPTNNVRSQPVTCERVR